MPIRTKRQQFFTVTVAQKMTRYSKYRVIAASKADAIKQIKRDHTIHTLLSADTLPDRVPIAITEVTA